MFHLLLLCIFYLSIEESVFCNIPLIETPPIPLTINTPPNIATISKEEPNPVSPVMPQLERAQPRVESTTNNEEEVEVITIDDSDSEDGIPNNLPPPLTKPSYVAFLLLQSNCYKQMCLIL